MKNPRTRTSFSGKLWISFVLSIVLFSCSHTQEPYLVQVNSIAEPNANKEKFYVFAPRVHGIDENDLQYREVTTFLERGLAEQGYQKTSAEKAEITILVSYSVSAPHHQKVIYSPNIYQTRQYYPRVSYFYYDQAGASRYARGYPLYPSYGPVAYQPQTKMVITYEHSLSLQAIDHKTDKPIWQMMIRMSYPNDDIRQTMPVMIAAAQNYIATDTEHQVNIQISEDDERIHLITQGEMTQ